MISTQVDPQDAHFALIYKNGILDYDAHDTYLRALGYDYLALPCACGGSDDDGHLPSCGWGRTRETYGVYCPSNNAAMDLHLPLLVDMAIGFLALDILHGTFNVPTFHYEPRSGPYELDRYSHLCSACEEPTRGEIYDSAYMPGAVFCSLDCRDAAEFAAEQVR